MRRPPDLRISSIRRTRPFCTRHMAESLHNNEASPPVGFEVPARLLGDDPPEETFPAIPSFAFARLVGRGPAGEVYRVFRRNSHRPLALKLWSVQCGAEGADRARREIARLSQLSAGAHGPGARVRPARRLLVPRPRLLWMDCRWNRTAWDHGNPWGCGNGWNSREGGGGSAGTPRAWGRPWGHQTEQRAGEGGWDASDCGAWGCGRIGGGRHGER